MHLRGEMLTGKSRMEGLDLTAGDMGEGGQGPLVSQTTL